MSTETFIILLISLFVVNDTLILLVNHSLPQPHFQQIVFLGKLVSQVLLTAETNLSKHSSTGREDIKNIIPIHESQIGSITIFIYFIKIDFPYKICEVMYLGSVMRKTSVCWLSDVPSKNSLWLCNLVEFQSLCKVCRCFNN